MTTSYFFLFDFYNNKFTSDESDHLVESIIYFYPTSEEFKLQKEIDCRGIIGLLQYFKYDSFFAYPTEIYYKKSIVKIEHYGRHCAFLSLPKDRFTIDEANIHLKHILQLYHTLYGTFNHVQLTHPNIKHMTSYLKQTLTPIVEHVFNENRSIRNLFSVIDYSPLRRGTQLCLLHVKHFLYHLQSTYEITHGLFACEKRILYSTFDIDITYYIQVILGSGRLLPIIEASNAAREMKLRKGVAMIDMYIPQPPSLEPILEAVNNVTQDCSANQIPNQPIQRNSSTLSRTSEQSLTSFSTLPKSYSTSCILKTHDDPAGSSDDVTDLETDQTGDTSARSKTDETDSLLSSVKNENMPPTPKINTSSSNSHNSKEESLTEPQQETLQYSRPRGETLNRDFEESIRPGQPHLGPSDSLDKVIFQPMKSDPDSDGYGNYTAEDVLSLPPKAISTSFQRPRRKTITNASDAHELEYNSSHDQHDGSMKWGDVPEKNDEIERDEFVLYIQRNSRLTFTGIIKKRVLSEEYLQKLWYFLLTGMADLDRDIQVIPFAGECSKPIPDIKFQFNEQMHHAQYERLMDKNRFYYKIPSAETVSLAFSARNKINENPQREAIGLSKGKNSISITQNLPDRGTYFCRQFQETR